MLLITPCEVIRHAFSPRERISPSSIRPLKIDIAQEHFIRPRLGDELFEKLVEGQYADFTERYINPALAHFVRYGILAELCVEVGDRGALVYSASSDQTQTARQQETSDNQSKEQSATSVVELTGEKSTVVNNMVNTNSTESGQSVTTSAAQGSVSDVLKSGEGYNSQITNGTDKASSKEGRTTTDADTESTSGSGKTLVDENRTGSGENYRPALMAEVRNLTVRALADAQILLAKAVRHVERNAQQFDHYAPKSVANNIFF